MSEPISVLIICHLEENEWEGENWLRIVIVDHNERSEKRLKQFIWGDMTTAMEGFFSLMALIIIVIIIRMIYSIGVEMVMIKDHITWLPINTHFERASKWMHLYSH